VTGHQSQYQGPGRVCRSAAAAALLAVLLLPTLASTPRATAATAATSVSGAATAASLTEPVTVSLTSITPTIAVPRTPVVIIGTARNTGSVPIASPVARALFGKRPLTTRDAVSEWDDSTDEQPAAEVARTSLGEILAPGSVVRFALTIPMTAISHRQSFTVLPLRVDVVGTMPESTSSKLVLGHQQTFLPALSSVKEYKPLSVAWLVPLTLDPDAALHGEDGAARTAAWTKAIGPGSRLDRLISGTDSALVTWAIDPAVLGPPQAPEAAASSTTPIPTPNATSPPLPGSTANQDPVTQMTSTLPRRLNAAAPRHTLWSLPYADPDLAALLPLTSGNSALAALVSHPSTLDVTVGPARTDIAWPVDGTLTTEREARLRHAFSSQGLAAAVTSASTLRSPSGPTGDASRKTSGGLALLAYDEALSRAFAQTSSTASGATAIQRFLADSMALLGERPGTPNRSVLVAAPRTFAGDPTVLSSFFAAIAKAPWLSPTTTEKLLTASRGAPPEGTAVAATGSEGAATSTPASPTGSVPDPDPLSPGTSPLTSARLGAIPGNLSAITGIASIRDDAQPFQGRWTDAQEQQLSVRWRDHPGGPAAIDAATRAAITAVSSGVRVAPSSVNFFADKGVLQVTVVNDLAVPVHDVHLTLTPAQPRLLIEKQPGALRIGAKSRTNVPLDVTAIAAGLVPIEAVLTTPNGTPLGQNAHVDVRVQPTSTWIYWVLSGLAGVVLILGIYRSLRRGSTRASRPAAQEPPFDD
jgi:hypothetical protein